MSGGGTLVAEWNAAAWVASAGLVNANLVSAGNLGAQQITFNQKGLDLGMGNRTGNPYTNGDATEFFHTFNNVSGNTEVIATLNSGQLWAYTILTLMAKSSPWAGICRIHLVAPQSQRTL